MSSRIARATQRNSVSKKKENEEEEEEEGKKERRKTDQMKSSEKCFLRVSTQKLCSKVVPGSGGQTW